MKKIILAVFCTSLLYAQNKEVVYETIFLSPEKSSENLLVEGVKKHNQKFHSKGETTASLYSVLVGAHSGQYVWLNGPMEMSDYDAMPDQAHMEDWQKNIRNYATSETVKLAKLNWEASYSPPSWGNPKYLLWKNFKIKQDLDSYGKVLEAVTKIGQVLNAINAPHPRRVYESVFRSENGEDINLVYPFKTFSRFSKSNGLPEGFQAEYDKINGPGAFRKDVGDVLSKHTNGWHDEVLMLIE
ncbi:hypothetical protein N9885_01390 [Flavobacteriaceae bacterium]|nr:hypothetical protein [Flavobacteriaceae bacterium]